MFWKQGNKAVYRKSNSIKDTLFQPNTVATHYTKKLLTSTDASERQVLGQGLLEEMSRSLSIPVPQLTVNDKRQNHSLKDGKLKRKVYGTYKAGKIVLSNKTAIREATLAPKTFLDTLIHEFMHHYDYEVLKFPVSLHTAGFYYRLGDVMKKLIG
ncbi:MAG: hypothetical protein A2545_02565 [Planctomycetes bacterium RIFOXYD2_FULL_41_16]|nr:MAG: hypothetical protein A2094_02315 [Planctomycetes bacterium GWE2_41_14]OHC07202.1 MAG: hypothetical protein A3J92_01200 [Planctomycetes bacterium RIFOXYC2_FULL_41_27]OHC08146.1 MAG: hypothetical protein A2545_02565 [Planctomycetes bacterium RIFOXYD2_FULL_41_16]OHC11211.1 MAG: hypothetical protein A3K50_01405 [Planctomycetes bacterium RIFOXYD12_FULL_42_12]